MAEIKVLIEGYAREEKNEEFASSTTTLVRTGKLKIIVDPGMNRKLLLEALEKENLSSKDINYIFLSHYHLDHSLLTGIFENAEVLYTEDVYSFDGKISKREDKLLGEDIQFIKTPGHNSDCRTMLVKTDDETVAICQDVIWWKDDEEQKTDKESIIEHEDPYATDMKLLKESREKVLESANYIIPGHGGMFKVK